MAYIQKRTDAENNIRYRVQVRLKGHPIQTATFERLTDAKNWAKITEGAIKDGRHFRNTEAKKRTLGELIDRYIKDIMPTKPKSGEKQRSQLEWWKQELGHYFLADISPALIGEKRDMLLGGTTRLKKKRSNATVVRYLAALSHALSVAVKEWAWLDDSPMRKVRKPKESRGRVRFLSEIERKALLEACQQSENKYLYTIVVLALSTGMRRGEIINLKWDDINTKDSYLILHETKNGERRRIPLTSHALECIKEMDKVRRIDTPLLFPSDRKKVQSYFWKHWLKALKEAGIEDFRFHDLRHTTASYLAMNGASIAEIAEVLGHKTLQMVKRYSHLSEGHTSKVVESMNRRIFG